MLRAARRLREATVAVVSFLDEQLSDSAHDPGSLDSIVEELGLGATRMEHLRDYFIEHPDGLISGRSDGPASRIYLLNVLADRYPQVSLPRCGGCGRTVALPKRGKDGQRRCSVCYARMHVEKCVICGRDQPVARRDPEGRSICPNCAAQDRTRWEPCSICGKTKRVVTRADAGPICNECLPRRLTTCVICGKDRPVHAFSPTGPHCSTCYHRNHRFECSLCRRLLAAAPRRGEQGERICDACWDAPAIPCRVCGLVKMIKKTRADGTGLCNRCEKAAAPRRECAECGRMKPTRMRLPIGAVCGGCAFRLRYTPAPCPNCQEVRPLIGRDSHGRRICGPCSGETKTPTCPTCRRIAYSFSGGRCITCTARQALHDVVRTADGETHPQLQDLATVFDLDHHPQAVMAWAKESKSAQTLRRVAKGGGVITHQALDDGPSGRHVEHLRQLLVFADILPSRDNAIEGTKKWFADWIADADPDTTVLLQRYVIWSLLRRARARRHRPIPVNPKTLRRRIITARHWLDWLNSNGLSLTDANQGHVDRWLAEGAQTRHELRDFVLWTQREQLCGPLTVPFRRQGQPHQFLTEDHRWAALRRCAHDDTIPLSIRAVGGLVLLFGLAPARIVRLTTAEVTVTESRTLLTIGKAPLPLPDPLAAIVQAQLREASTARTRAVLPRANPTVRWLFPGEQHGRHADPARLVVVLRQHLGIRIRPSHNAAFSRWADDLPLPILADVLGINPNTAARWAALVQHNWVPYVAERATATDKLQSADE